MRVIKNHDGALILSEWVHDGTTVGAFLHNQVYYGYTQREARRVFAEHLKKNGLTPERD